MQVLDFDHPADNDWLVVNQFTVVENKHERRPDVVLFVNGLPLAVIELKNPADENATIWSAFQQLQTCKAEIPSLFAFNAALVVSDGLEARIGTLTSNSAVSESPNDSGRWSRHVWKLSPSTEGPSSLLPSTSASSTAPARKQCRHRYRHR